MKMLFIMIIIFYCLIGCNKTESLSQKSQIDIKNKTEYEKITGSVVFNEKGILSLIGNNNAVDIVKMPEKVFIYRLADKVEKEIVSDPIPLTAKLANKLSKLLVDKKSYLWNSKKLCMPKWDVMITFQKGKENINVLFSFSCDILRFEDGSGEDFDRIRKDLLAIIKPLLPKDKIIQSLK